MGIKENIERLRARIEEAARGCGRSPGDITLVAVSKEHRARDIREAYGCGLRAFGENYAQDLRAKYAELSESGSLDIDWHFIGGLQRNKVKYVVGKVSLIHSVDGADIAREIDKKSEKLGALTPVLIEVNAGREPTKRGIPPEGLEALLASMSGLKSTRVEGLMTVAPYADDPEGARPVFRALRELRDEFSGEYPCLRHLSMGMTADFAVAIEEGATIIRVGTAIFGPRRAVHGGPGA